MLRAHEKAKRPFFPGEWPVRKDFCNCPDGRRKFWLQDLYPGSRSRLIIIQYRHFVDRCRPLVPLPEIHQNFENMARESIDYRCLFYPITPFCAAVFFHDDCLQQGLPTSVFVTKNDKFFLYRLTLDAFELVRIAYRINGCQPGFLKIEKRHRIGQSGIPVMQHNCRVTVYPDDRKGKAFRPFVIYPHHIFQNSHRRDRILKKSSW